jgi:hypothetical protein
MRFAPRAEKSLMNTIACLLYDQTRVVARSQNLYSVTEKTKLRLNAETDLELLNFYWSQNDRQAVIG